MSEQTRPQPPREIDREDVLGELEYRFKEADPSHAIAWVLDELVELDILSFRERAECGIPEGMSGIACQLPKGHIMPDGSLRVVHEGTTTPEQAALVGYEIFTRWPVDGKTLPVAEAEKPYSVTLVMPCGHDTTEHGPVCPNNVELPDWERVSSAPESIPLVCGARWDGARSCEHEPNHDGKHGFFRSPDAGWFEWTSSREVV